MSQRIKVMVTMMAEVDVAVEEHPDGEGANIRPLIEDNNLIVSYAAYNMPENTPEGAKVPITTACAHLMAKMAVARFSNRLNRREPDEPFSGPTQPMGQA